MAENIAYEIGELLKGCHKRLGTAESATGGLISKLITDIPGSSHCFRGAIISYDDEIKRKLLGVSEDTLRKYGAVSQQAAEEMAEGARRLLEVDIALSDTGIAGPTGETPEKPVGLFYIGLASRDGVRVEKHIFQGSREENRMSAAIRALTLLKEYLLDTGESRTEASSYRF